MRMGKEKSAARDAHRRKYKGCKTSSYLAVLHQPLEYGKCDNHCGGGPMLEYFDLIKALPEAVSTQGPILRIRSDEYEEREGKKHQRPVSRNGKFARPRNQRKSSHDKK